MKKLIVFILLGLMLVLVACDRAETPEATTVPEADQLPVEQATTLAQEPAATSLESVQNIVWQWSSLEETLPASLSVVPDPENYTLTLLPDGTAPLKADCNQLTWTYRVEGESLIFDTLGPSTLAFCGEESLDQQFLAQLSQVRSFSLVDSFLKLHLAEDTGMMSFSNGGTIAETPANEQQPDGEIRKIVWQWADLVETEPAGQSVVPNPENYTLTLLPDNVASIKADCNQVSWTYTMEQSSVTASGSLTFNTLGPSTLAFCGEESLDQQYLALLGQTATFNLEEGRLKLNLADNAGIMGLNNGGTVDAPDGPGTPNAGIGLDPRQISLDTQGLPYSWQANIVPASPYDESQPPGPKGLPEHIQINFGVTDPADRQLGDPIMYIIPVDAYQQMWKEAGNISVSDTIDRIYDLSVGLPSPAPTSGIPVVPTEEIGGVNDLAVQIVQATSDENSATKNGYRFVGRWNQDANPVTNQGLRYVYQGFTNDGQYLVSFWYPVSISTLPGDVSGVSQEDMDKFNQDFQSHIDEKSTLLNALPSSDWEPDLATLDTLVGSLQIEGMPLTGLHGQTWQWQATRSGDGTLNPVNNPAVHTLTFNSDGTFNVQADCNNAGGSYTADGGVAGTLTFELGPMTLAMCEPESRSDELLNSLLGIQDYSVLPGGRNLELPMTSGGPVLLFSAPKTPDPEVATPVDTVEEAAEGVTEETTEATPTDETAGEPVSAPTEVVTYEGNECEVQFLIDFPVFDGLTGQQTGTYSAGEYVALQRATVDGIIWIQIAGPDGSTPWASTAGIATAKTTGCSK